MTSTSHIGKPTRGCPKGGARRGDRQHGRVVRLRDLQRSGHLHRRQVLPVRERHRRAAQHVRDLRRGLLHATARRLLLRTARGPDRPPARAGDRDPADVGLDVRDRSGAELRHHRRGRPADTSASPLPARLFGGRRVRQRRLLPGRVCAGQAPRLRRLVPGVVGRRGLPARLDHRHRAAGDSLRGRDELVRVAHSVPAGGRARQRRALHPATAARHPRIRGVAGRRRGVGVAARRKHSRRRGGPSSRSSGWWSFTTSASTRCSRSCRATSPRRSA